MDKSRDFRHGRHCVFAMHVHLVFVTTYRRCIFDGRSHRAIETYLSKVCADFESQLVQMDGESNHLHLLVNYPPKVSVSSLVNSLKGASSYVLRRQLPRIAKCYWKNVLWSPSYFAASCGGAPLDIIKRRSLVSKSHLHTPPGPPRNSASSASMTGKRKMTPQNPRTTHRDTVHAAQEFQGHSARRRSPQRALRSRAS